MDYNEIHNEANLKMAVTYGVTGIPPKGYIIVTVDNKSYKVHFERKEDGWLLRHIEEIK